MTAIDPLRPYDPLLRTTVRVLTWNVWGRFGPWQQRQSVLAEVLAGSGADVVVLTEAWSADDRDQGAELAAAAGLGHHVFAGSRTDQDGARSGVAVLSRWPVRPHGLHALPGGHGRVGAAVRVDVDGPRGPLWVVGVVLDWPPHYSHVRQEQVRELAGYVGGLDRDALGVVCGDFNAGPDTDEIRMLTGRAAGLRVAWQDAWELGGDGGAGHTWSRDNPWAAPLLQPDRRIDYVFSVRLGPGGRGHPVAAAVVGRPADGPDAVVGSDHFGVVADLRY